MRLLSVLRRQSADFILMKRGYGMIDDQRLNNIKFYQNKRVLVTGHTGFKGTWLTAVLNFMGAKAVGYALAPKPDGLYQKICGNELIHHVSGDLMDSSLLERTILEFQPEIVFHLAAYGAVPKCFEDPVRTYQTNLVGSTILLEALRNCPSVKSIVLESVDHVNKSDPYSISKICMEHMAQEYLTSYFQTDGRITGIAAVCTGNMPAGDSHIYTELMNKPKPHNLLQTRRWHSVLDTLDWYLTVSRMLYENPSVYAGVWDVQSWRQKTEWNYRLSGEEVIDQAMESVKCQLDGKQEREICMRMIAAYYGAETPILCREQISEFFEI